MVGAGSRLAARLRPAHPPPLRHPSCPALPPPQQLYNYEKYGTPYRRGQRYYCSHNSGLQNQFVLYSQGSLEGEARVLLDPNTLSDDGTVALGGQAFSEDGCLYGAVRGRAGDGLGTQAAGASAAMEWPACPCLPTHPTPPRPDSPGSLHAVERRVGLAHRAREARGPRDWGGHGCAAPVWAHAGAEHACVAG